MKSYSYLYIGYSHDSSDVSDNDSSLHGESQPYKEFYSVYAKMVKYDIKIGVYRPDFGGYSLNPTTKKLDDLFDGEKINIHAPEIMLPYVINENWEVIVGRRNGNGNRNTGALPTPHPTLIGGLDPKVRMAGILHIKNGKIASYDNQSGHFRPNIKSMWVADKAFKKYPKTEDFAQ